MVFQCIKYEQTMEKKNILLSFLMLFILILCVLVVYIFADRVGVIF